MLKGVQRRMVEVRTDKSSLFKTAYFVLRDEAPQRANGCNIVDEAYERISSVLEGAQEKRRGKRRKRSAWQRAVIFAAGFLCGVGGAVLFILLRTSLGL